MSGKKKNGRDETNGTDTPNAADAVETPPAADGADAAPQSTPPPVTPVTKKTNKDDKILVTANAHICEDGEHYKPRATMMVTRERAAALGSLVSEFSP